MPAEWTRRDLLGSAAAMTLLAPNLGRALGRSSRFHVAELSLPPSSLSRPSAWERILYEVVNSTSIEADPATVLVAPDSPELFAHPFSVLIGSDALPPLSDTAAEQLLRYLSYGGFLLIDDASASPDGPFARSVRRLCARLFPTRALSPLPSDHSVYRSFFLLDRPYGRTAVSRVLEGVTVGPITPLIFCPNDLSGAMERAADGRDLYPVVPGGNRQRTEALKLGVNLVLYSLTSNYKHDQAHVLQLIREGRLE